MTSGTNHQKKLKSGTRDKILDAAEMEFSIHGYERCSLRMISEDHDINLGLIHYYFGGKEGLFSSVFLRRSRVLARRRKTLLKEARLHHNKGPIPVEEIIRCFVVPTIEMIKQGGGPGAYIRLQGRLRFETADFTRELHVAAFGETNKKFIRELQRSCPHLTPAAVVWRFSAMVGAFCSLTSQSSRVRELSDGLCDTNDVEMAFSETIPFVVGGFKPPRDPARGLRTASAAQQHRSNRGMERTSESERH